MIKREKYIPKIGITFPCTGIRIVSSRSQSCVTISMELTDFSEIQEVLFIEVPAYNLIIEYLEYSKVKQ